MEGSLIIKMLGNSGSLPYQIVTKTLGLFVAFSGVVVMIGWLLHIDVLKSVIPGLATMKFNTALCFLFAGISLFFSHQHATNRSRLFAFVGAGLVVLLAVATLIQYAGSWNFGIDELFVNDPATPIEMNPGRMSVASALDFALIALAIILLDIKISNGFRPSTMLALVGVLISGAALLGYLYGVRTIRVSIFTSMALHTAFLFVALGLGVVLVRPSQGPMTAITDNYVGGRLARTILPAVVIVPIIFGWLSLSGLLLGNYGAEFAFALFTLSSIAVLVVLVWYIAISLNRMQQQVNNVYREKAFLAAIVESSDDAIISKDLNSKIVSWNSGAERIYGYTKEEMLGNSITIINSSENSIEEEKILTSIKQGERMEHIESVRRHKDGHPLAMSITVSPIIGADGKVVGASHIGRDISQRIRSEKELQEKNNELIRSNKDLEQFAYVASHDLQEPLRAVGGCVQLLSSHLNEHMDKKSEQYMSHVVDGVNRMQALIEDLLLYSRVGRVDSDLKTTESGQVLNFSLKNLAVAIAESEAEIIFSNLPTVYAVPAQLILVFQNLIGNAIKFRRKENKLRIDIEATAEDEKWIFSVKDNGIGIEQRYFERIFTIFQRLHTRREYPGTGIGLALCKRIVEQHGGKIWVESVAGEGTTIKFSLLASAGGTEKNNLLETDE